MCVCVLDVCLLSSCFRLCLCFLCMCFFSCFCVRLCVRVWCSAVGVGYVCFVSLSVSFSAFHSLSLCVSLLMQFSWLFLCVCMFICVWLFCVCMCFFNKVFVFGWPLLSKLVWFILCAVSVFVLMFVACGYMWFVSGLGCLEAFVCFCWLVLVCIAVLRVLCLVAIVRQANFFRDCMVNKRSMLWKATFKRRRNSDNVFVQHVVLKLFVFDEKCWNTCRNGFSGLSQVWSLRKCEKLGK